jgi:hypothetical protein
VTHLERVMLELEEKNKRMTDLINTSIMNKAQNYQDHVMNKLLNSRSTIQPKDSNVEANSG